MTVMSNASQREELFEVLLIYNREKIFFNNTLCYSIDEPEAELLYDVFQLSPRGVLNVKCVLSHD